jgi:hypothetical protein
MHRLLKTENIGSEIKGTPIVSPVTNGGSLLTYHLDFLGWYIEFLKKELQPAASYQRHISALTVLRYLTNVGLQTDTYPTSTANAHSVGCATKKGVSTDRSLLRLLLDLTVDPFDDVRGVAAKLLESYSSLVLMQSVTNCSNSTDIIDTAQERFSNESCVVKALHKAEVLMQQTGRADYADGVGRLYNLLYSSLLTSTKSQDLSNGRCGLLNIVLEKLENDVQIAQNSLQLAITSAPLHGHLTILR